MLSKKRWTVLFFWMTCVIGSGHAVSLRVPLEYPTIQAGINSATTGDTVTLESGLYFGEGNRDLDFLGKDIVVCSEDGDPATCIITCQGSLNSPHRGFVFHSGETSQASLEGVTISEGWTGEPNLGGAITCLDGASPTIKNCRLVNCFSDLGAGGVAIFNSSPSLIDCWIDNNASIFGCGGVAAEGSGSLTMVRCLMTGNASQEAGIGGLVLACDDAYLFQCTIAYNQGVGLYSQVPLSLSFCTVVGNDIGIFVPSSEVSALFEHSLFAFNAAAFDENCAPVELSCCNTFGNAGGDWPNPIIGQQGINGNISADPLLCDPGNWDYRVAPDSPCLGGLCGQIGAWGEGDCSGNFSSVAGMPLVDFHLLGNHPNPFNPSTTIRYELNQELPVSLQIFDVTGKLVATLVDGETMGEGLHEVIWNGRDKAGQSVAAGVFLYVLTTPMGRDSGRMALIK